MSKQEFLDKLRAALQGSLNTALVTENVNYYEDYINTEIRKGRNEEEVMAALGDPRLIAKTITQTQGAEEDSAYSTADYRSVSQGSARYQGNDPYQEKRHSIRVLGWLVGVLVFIVLLVIFNLVFSVLAYLSPIILVAAALVFVVKLFHDWLS